MAGFGLRELASREPAGTVDGCMDLYSWPNFVVFFLCQPLRSQYSPIISSLDFTHHFEV